MRPTQLGFPGVLIVVAMMLVITSMFVLARIMERRRGRRYAVSDGVAMVVEVTRTATLVAGVVAHRGERVYVPTWLHLVVTEQSLTLLGPAHLDPIIELPWSAVVAVEQGVARGVQRTYPSIDVRTSIAPVVFPVFDRVLVGASSTLSLAEAMQRLRELRSTASQG